MKQAMYLSDFRNAFRRADRKENFSHEGLAVLFDYLEEINPDGELDVIELCCEYSEMTLEELNEEYCEEFETLEEASDKLSETKTVCGTTDDSIIFAAY